QHAGLVQAGGDGNQAHLEARQAITEPRDRQQQCGGDQQQNQRNDDHAALSAPACSTSTRASTSRSANSSRISRATPAYTRRWMNLGASPAKEPAKGDSRRARETGSRTSMTMRLPAMSAMSAISAPTSRPARS